MKPSRPASIRAGVGAAALVTAALAGAAPAAAAAEDRPLPRGGSTLIVQPASVGLITGHELSWAQFTVRDGCGRTLKLGSPAVDGTAASVPLPAQGSGPGTWHVTWTAGRTGGSTTNGAWAFDVAQGTACPGSPEAAALAAAGARAGHHGGAASESGEAEVTSSGTRRPVLAFIAAVLGGLAIGSVGWVLIRRQRRRDDGVTLPDAATVICFLTLMLTLAGGGAEGSLLGRLGLALPAAILITGTVLNVVAQMRLRLVRALMSGWSAAIATAILVGLWEAGRSRLMVIPGTEAYAALPLQTATAGLVVVVLAVGGWFYGRRVPAPAPS